jgi:hypothetical protein
MSLIELLLFSGTYERGIEMPKACFRVQNRRCVTMLGALEKVMIDVLLKKKKNGTS